MKAVSVTSMMLLLGSVSMGYAAPTNETEYPEVIPGPGLPSLASLGLTSADLYEKKPLPLSSRSSDLAARANTEYCVDSPAVVTDAIACYRFLLNLGNTACVVNGGSTFCTANTAQIQGFSSGRTSSPCSAVAQAVLVIIDDCRIPNTIDVGGVTAVQGNDNLGVIITGS